MQENIYVVWKEEFAMLLNIHRKNVIKHFMYLNTSKFDYTAWRTKNCECLFLHYEYIFQLIFENKTATEYLVKKYPRISIYCLFSMFQAHFCGLCQSNWIHLVRQIAGSLNYLSRRASSCKRDHTIERKLNPMIKGFHP